MPRTLQLLDEKLEFPRTGRHTLKPDSDGSQTTVEWTNGRPVFSAVDKNGKPIEVRTFREVGGIAEAAAVCYLCKASGEGMTCKKIECWD